MIDFKKNLYQKRKDISCYLKPVSKYLKVILASIHYPDIQNVDVKTILSLCTILLLVIQIIYFKRVT